MKEYIKILSVGIISSFITFCSINYFNKENSFEKKSKEKDINFKTVNYTTKTTPNQVNLNFEYAAEHTVNSVVHVKTEITEHYKTYDPFENFFGNGNGIHSKERKHKASGSGVIISEDGYIVTNNHVINNADKIEVTLNNKETYVATLVGNDPSTDIALLKINANNLSFVNFANSNDLKLGEWVIAVGNPFNLTSTVTAGIVSAKARNINILQANPEEDVFPVESFIQTDAAVNPGNSGGALVNTNGELIGINTAIASQTGSFTGYSFAVPSNLVLKVASDLKKYGSVQRAFLGISIMNINDEIEETLKLESKNGVYVSGLSENGSARNAGILVEDIIVKIEDYPVNSVPELQEKIASYIPGDKVIVEIIRDEKIVLFEVELKNKKGTTEIIENDKIYEIEAIGIKTANKKSEKGNEVEIIGIKNEKLTKYGITKGFIISKIDHQRINTINDLEKIIRNSDSAILIEGYYPNNPDNEIAFAIVLP